MDADQSDEKRSQPQTHLLANLRELMAAWFAARDQGGETGDVEQRIAAEAAAQGLSLGFKSMALVDVPDDGFPLVLLEKGGASRLVLARLNLQTYLCLGQGARYEVSAATLAQVESGTVFFCTRLAATEQGRSERRIKSSGWRYRGRSALFAERGARRGSSSLIIIANPF